MKSPALPPPGPTATAVPRAQCRLPSAKGANVMALPLASDVTMLPIATEAPTWTYDTCEEVAMTTCESRPTDGLITADCVMPSRYVASLVAATTEPNPPLFTMVY